VDKQEQKYYNRDNTSFQLPHLPLSKYEIENCHFALPVQHPHNQIFNSCVIIFKQPEKSQVATMASSISVLPN